ncbi:UDP-glucose dehydrogenase family protein [Fodinicurvata fenggangensis]|uniref:UDP-glucose dehydrogenase family protein n=1 Tax=Fodinicurvata fenggangensis TaxID=1121830 RepID=UPI00047AED86|nr:UDP-glucose/GDP-mannose dehydrogenase family protein [Fodinicurvata fenggangensis]
MKITMIGTGYVGLVSGTCFSEFGWNVTCLDRDADKIAALQAGEVPIYEPGLEPLVARNVQAGRLAFTTDLKAAVKDADAVFLAVGTPSDPHGRADLSYVYAAAEELADNLDGFTVIVTKSTVPVGTGREIARRIRERRPDLDFEVASNPEFLREGAAVEDFLRPDRVILGVEGERAAELLQTLYRPLALLQKPMVVTGLETAEVIKYAANAFLATKITFINEIADLCEQVGGNVQDVARGMGLDGRIGPKFLHAGPGFGGSCFPKDTRALVQTGQDAGANQRIVEAVVAVNEARKAAMADKVAEACGGALQGKTIGLLGVTFKPNTDDVRESTALDLVPALQQAGARVQAFDPVGMDNAKPLLPDVDWRDDAYAALDGADALVLLTEWNEFRGLDLPRVKQLLAQPVVVDLRNIYTPQEMNAAGLNYYSIGRPPMRVIEG